MEGPLAALKVSGRLGNAGGFTGGTGTLSEVHFAAEDCVVFNGEAEGADVALDRAAGTQPWIRTSLAARSAATLALEPMVRRFSARLMVPSTRPSTMRSSLPFTSPLMTTVLPMRAGEFSTGIVWFLPGP